MTKNTNLKIYSIFFMLLSGTVCFGQFLPNANLTDNKFDLRVKNYSGLVSATMKYNNNKVYLNWTVLNDTLEGHFAVLKSVGYCGPIKTIDMVYFSKNIDKNVPVMFSSVDSTTDCDYNTYFIVKIDRNLSDVLVEENILKFSFVSFVVPYDRTRKSPVQIKDQTKELYTQGF